MRKIISIMLIIAVVIFTMIPITTANANDTVMAYKASSKVFVDGEIKAFDAYNIKDNNYFKLRDIAYVLSATTVHFDVAYDSKTNMIQMLPNKPYIPVGGEMAIKSKGERENAIPSKSPIYLEGKKYELTAYNINGNNYFKLRDVADVIGFYVEWDDYGKSISINTKINPLEIATDVTQRTNINRYLSNYGTAPTYAMSFTKDKNIILTIDKEDNNVEVIFFDDKQNISNKLLIKKEFPIFGGFTVDETDNLYIMYGRDVKEESDKNPNIALCKYSKDGKLVNSFIEQIFNTKVPLQAATSRVTYGNGKVAMHFGRGYYKGYDGLNHQAGTMIVVDSKTMQIDDQQSAYQTTGHSFDQRTIYDSQKDSFVALDLGDNYPRGIQIMANNNARVIFTFKTNMPDIPSPYRNLPAGKWSNDNATYTQLGGIEISSNGYIVAGTSEKSIKYQKDENGNSNEPRNLFAILVNRNFEDYRNSSTNVVSSDIVISKGENSQPFGFYTFDGGYEQQQRTGVIWLTNYTDKTAITPQLVKITDDKFALCWQVLDFKTQEYLDTRCMIIDDQCKILTQEFSIGKVPLPTDADIMYKDGKLIWLMIKDKIANLIILDL